MLSLHIQHVSIERKQLDRKMDGQRIGKNLVAPWEKQKICSCIRNTGGRLGGYLYLFTAPKERIDGMQYINFETSSLLSDSMYLHVPPVNGSQKLCDSRLAALCSIHRRSTHLIIRYLTCFDPFPLLPLNPLGLSPNPLRPSTCVPFSLPKVLTGYRMEQS